MYFSVDEAAPRLEELCDRALAGEAIFITLDQIVVQLVPVEPTAPSELKEVAP